MLSRLYDERVFTSSDDVVFSASTSQAVRGNRDRSGRRPTISTRRHMVHGDPLNEAKEESKSDVTSDDNDAPADDELDDDDDDEDDEQEEDEGEKRRMAGLLFPLQSPRHIASSQTYIHRQRRMEKATSPVATTPAARRRQARKLLDCENGNDHSTNSGDHRRGVMTLATDAPLSKEVRRRKIDVQYHEHPMELVFLSTGEIRARDECPPGLHLPAATDVRRLLEAPQSPTAKEKVQRSVQATLGESAASSTVHITRQANVEPRDQWQRERPEAIRTNVDVQGQRTDRPSTNHRAPSYASSGSDDGDSTDSDQGGRHRDTARKKVVSSSKPRSSPTQHTNAKIDRRDGVVSRSMPTASREETRGPAKETKPNMRRDREDPGSGDEGVSDKGMISHSRTAKSSSTRNLEAELQKEKKRVLEKMTKLLEEQGKTQALQHQLEMLKDKVKSMEKELEASARGGPSQDENSNNRAPEERIRLLSEQLQVNEDRIRRLESQLEQAEELNRDQAERRSQSKDDKKSARLRQREAALATQLEQLMNRVTDFHSQVEVWKVNSREAVEGCDKRADVLELMDRLWMDFPPFLSSSDLPRRKQSSTEGESSTIAFLTKKLRQKEEESRATHVKYVELKELCARQCIREADLQNFINEHRLRGNLVIRKTTDEAGATRLTPGGREQGNQQVRSNGPWDQYGNQEADPEHEDDEEDGAGDRVVQRPRVFIDIKRSNQPSELHQEPSPIEHVRLAPSPALAQRYRHQQQQQQFASVKQSTSHMGGGQHGRPPRPTVASASRALATTRHTLTTRTNTGTMKRRTGQPSTIVKKASRRPSQATLTSRPWV